MDIKRNIEVNGIKMNVSKDELSIVIEYLTSYNEIEQSNITEREKLALKAGVKDETYETVRNGTVSSYSGTADYVDSHGISYSASGYGPRGTGWDIWTYGSIDHMKMKDIEFQAGGILYSVPPISYKNLKDELKKLRTVAKNFDSDYTEILQNNYSFVDSISYHNGKIMIASNYYNKFNRDAEYANGQYRVTKIISEKSNCYIVNVEPIYFDITDKGYGIYSNSCTCSYCHGRAYGIENFPDGYIMIQLGARCPELLVFDPKQYICFWLSARGNVTDAFGSDEESYIDYSDDTVFNDSDFYFENYDPILRRSASAHSCYKLSMHQKVVLFRKNNSEYLVAKELKRREEIEKKEIERKEKFEKREIERQNKIDEMEKQKKFWKSSSFADLLSKEDLKKLSNI